MKKGAQMFLRAANKKYPDLYPKQQLRVGGVVTGVVRKFI
jgi:SOS-response transcriptional repressor LexA